MPAYYLATARDADGRASLELRRALHFSADMLLSDRTTLYHVRADSLREARPLVIEHASDIRHDLSPDSTEGRVLHPTPFCWTLACP